MAQTTEKYIYARGGRKQATSRVRLFINGQGKITINNKDSKIYLPDFELQKIILSPLKAVGEEKNVDLSIKVAGGGKNGQADAIRHGIARALIIFKPEYRLTLKPLGFLTRDARSKERKKPGLKRARRAPQWQKR